MLPPESCAPSGEVLSPSCHPFLLILLKCYLQLEAFLLCAKFKLFTPCLFQNSLFHFLVFLGAKEKKIHLEAEEEKKMDKNKANRLTNFMCFHGYINITKQSSHG